MRNCKESADCKRLKDGVELDDKGYVDKLKAEGKSTEPNGDVESFNYPTNIPLIICPSSTLDTNSDQFKCKARISARENTSRNVCSSCKNSKL